MVILLVAMGEALLPQLFTEFTVGMDESRAALRQGVILEDIRHVMEQPRHRKEHLRRCRSTLSFQKALRVSCLSFRPRRLLRNWPKSAQTELGGVCSHCSRQNRTQRLTGSNTALFFAAPLLPVAAP